MQTRSRTTSALLFAALAFFAAYSTRRSAETRSHQSRQTQNPHRHRLPQSRPRAIQGANHRRPTNAPPRQNHLRIPRLRSGNHPHRHATLPRIHQGPHSLANHRFFQGSRRSRRKGKIPLPASAPPCSMPTIRISGRSPRRHHRQHQNTFVAASSSREKTASAGALSEPRLVPSRSSKTQPNIAREISTSAP